jgi:hypothetical protein
MVSSFVVFTDTTVGLRRAAPHRAAALDLPGGRLISRTAAGFRQGPRPPRRRGEFIADATRRRVDGPLEVGQLGDDRRPEQLIVGRGDGADALGVGRPPGLERPALDQQAEDTSELELRRRVTAFPGRLGGLFPDRRRQPKGAKRRLVLQPQFGSLSLVVCAASAGLVASTPGRPGQHLR